MARTPNKRTESDVFPPADLFAQPLLPEAQIGAHRALRPGAAFVLLPGLMCAAIVAIAQTDAAHRWNAEGRARNLTAAPPLRLAQNAPAVDAPELRPAAPARRPLDFYTGGVRASLFSAPVPPQPKPKPVVKPAPPKPVQPIKVPIPPVVEINPFATWVYAGTIKMGDTLVALVENSQGQPGAPREGQYVKVGDSVMGAQVTAVTDSQVSLSNGAKSYTLAKSATINVTPLDASANPTPAPPGQPGQPQPGQPMPGMPGMNMQGGTVILPNGAVLNERDAARRDRFMNRNFRRGQDGGGDQNRDGGGRNRGNR